MERREQVTRIGIIRVNGQPEELDGLGGRRQPSMGGTSRVSREAQARFREGLGAKFPGPTRRVRAQFPLRAPLLIQIVKEPRDRASCEDTASADFVRCPVNRVCA